MLGPGTLVMLSENDAPSMLAYAATGATYGIGAFLPFIGLTFVMAYVVQEIVLRIGIATQRGLAPLIARRFGPVLGSIAILDLVIANVAILVAEFAGISAGAAYFGIPKTLAVVAGASLVIAASLAGRYATWERIVLGLAALNVLFIPAAMLSHPNLGDLARAFATWSPLPARVDGRAFMLVIANIGASVTPWMLFFQQSAVVDKGLTRADLRRGRADTAFGTVLAAVVALSAAVAATPLFAHHVDLTAVTQAADFATALRPYLGSIGATCVAIGMIEAGVVAAITIATSSAYAVSDIRPAGSLVGGGSVVIAAAVVLVPNAPLLTLTIAANILAAVLMIPALLFIVALANDRDVMGSLASGRLANLAAGAVLAAIIIALLIALLL